MLQMYWMLWLLPLSMLCPHSLCKVSDLHLKLFVEEKNSLNSLSEDDLIACFREVWTS